MTKFSGMMNHTSRTLARKKAAFIPWKRSEMKSTTRIFDARAQRAVQEYLVRLRKRSVIEVKSGYVDTGATR
jgi:hypothetical protein